ncbi:MAG: hypothetical protein H6Q05_3161 [Acidobacteria bacterium]|nr:hypothetical protein [Acidobacteriota bacterium]
MREIRTSGSMSGDGKRAGALSANAPIFDSTEDSRQSASTHQSRDR